MSGFCRSGWFNYQNSIQLSVSNIRNFYNCQVLAWLCSKNLTKFLSNYHYLTGICTKFCCIILCSARNMIILEKYTHKLLNSSVWNDHIMIQQWTTSLSIDFWSFSMFCSFFITHWCLLLFFTLVRALYDGQYTFTSIILNPSLYIICWIEVKYPNVMH